MKDSKFIELLNLYVDHQIGAAEAALLEAEIQQSPKRRQVYREYCRMQKACVLLADKFREDAPVVAFAPARRRLASFAFATGLVAAAACVALVLVNRNRPGGLPLAHDGGNASVALAAPVQPLGAANPVHAMESNRPALQPAFKGLLHNGDAVDTTFTSADRAPLDWMTRVQFDRVPVDGLRFDNVQTVPAEDLMFRNHHVFQSQTEGAAFRFQK